MPLRAPSPACRRSRCTSSDRRHRHAGRRAQRARGDEPRGAEGQPGRGAARVDDPRQRGRVRRAQPQQGRLRRQPARGRLARRVPRHPGADDHAHARGVQGARREAARRGALEELLRPRPDLVDVHAPDRADDRVDRPALRQAADGARRQRSPRSRPACTSARPPRSSTTPTRSRRRSCRRASTATSPATSRWRTASSPVRRRPTLPILYASYPITPASDILHELSKLQELRRAHAAGRRRDRRRGGRDRRRVRRPARRHRHQRPGRRPQG